jgi:cytidylate kinase
LSANMSTLLQDIRARDTRDSSRTVAPLQKSGEAIEIDTTSLTVDEATRQIVSRFQRAP